MRRFSETCIKLLKGCLIGSSIVVPGVSGGSMAMSMGIYDSIIRFTTAHRRDSGRAGRALIPYGLGILIGIVLFSYFIELALMAFPLQTAGAFTGLILGVLPMLFRRIEGSRISKRHILLLLLTAGLLIAMTVFGSRAEGAYALTPSVLNGVVALGLGFLGAATMVIPGVSGSMLLLLLGCYDSMLQHVTGFTNALFQLDGAALLSHLAILLPFALGAVLGIIGVSRMITTLLNRHPLSTYYAIIGLVAGSPFAVLHHQDFTGAAPGGIIAAALCAVVGFALAALLGRKEETP